MTANSPLVPIMMYVVLHAIYGSALGFLAVKWKGKEFKHWFLVGFLFTIPALLVLLFLKSEKVAVPKETANYPS